MLDRASMACSVLQDLAGLPAGPVAIAASQLMAVAFGMDGKKDAVLDHTMIAPIGLVAAAKTAGG